MGRICGVAENWSNAFRACPLHLPLHPPLYRYRKCFTALGTINSRHDVTYGLQHL